METNLCFELKSNPNCTTYQPSMKHSKASEKYSNNGNTEIEDEI